MDVQDLFLIAGLDNQSLQSLINRISQSGAYALLIPSFYTGTDKFTNPTNVPVIDLRPQGPSTGLGGTLAIQGGGASAVVFAQQVTTTASSSDTYAISGATSLTAVTLFPANASAAVMLATGEVSATVSGASVTITHPATSGAIFNLIAK